MEWKELIHTDCGKVAILYKDKKYYVSDIPCADDFKHVDGTEYNEFFNAICDSCGKRIKMLVDNDNNLCVAASIIEQGDKR